ncbi:PAS domain S-box protein [Arenibaculum pallidiluteum]|uniref:PAS domain S-box protein n=1 Tax=Arenibaculum pallidiluteum TaxID=2812559 RepID=UPI001A96D977|nr:PAS domain S-box protein [Arenibaculum pallidiluteum]
MSISDQMQQLLLASIIESADDAIISKDLDGIVTSWNRAAERLFGYTAEEMIGRSIAILAVPDVPDEMPPILEQIRRGEKIDHYETRRRHKDGHVIDISLTVSPVRDAQGRIVGASKIARDISDRLSVQREKGLLAAIVDSSDDAIVSKDLNGIVTSWNGAAERLFGYTAEEMIGRPIAVLAAPDRLDEMPLILERVRRGEKVQHYETRRRHKEGRILDISLTVSPVLNAQGRIIGASKIAHDISERLRAERQVREMMHELDHRAKNVLAVAQAIVRLTKADDIAQYSSLVQGRISALARAHSQVAENKWHGASLDTLVASELEPFRAGEATLTSRGPEVLLAPTAAQAVAIVLHELATNAAKHGALSAPKGSVEVTWFLDGPEDALTLRWVESGVSGVRKPARRSFGTRVIERQIPDQLKGKARIEWAATGLRCEFEIPRSYLMPSHGEMGEPLMIV